MDIEMTEPGREQSRARYPDSRLHRARRGTAGYEVYGSGEPAVLLLTWLIVHARHWKTQVPYLARHCRVITFDGRGNGRSDRPAAGYGEPEYVADALAVMDATATDRAVIVSLSVGAQRALTWRLSIRTGCRGRVLGPALPSPRRWGMARVTCWMRCCPPRRAGRKTSCLLAADYRGFLEFFFSQMFTEPHSTKPTED